MEAMLRVVAFPGYLFILLHKEQCRTLLTAVH